MIDSSFQSTRTPEKVSELYAAGHWRTEFATDYLDRWASEDSEKVAVYDGAVRLTWKDLQERSCALAGVFRELGLNQGDRVAVQLPNWHEFAVSYLALARMRAVMVPIMPVYRQREVNHVLSHAGAKAYLYSPVFRNFDYRQMARDLASSIPSLEHRIAVRSSTPCESEELSFEALIARGEGRWVPEDFERSDPDDHHLIVFTSGTESKAKGCLHTWNSYSYTPHNQTELYEFGRNDIELCVSPITHTTGLASGLLKPLVSGGALCLLDVWDPKVALGLIEEFGCTQTTGATPFLSSLIDAAREIGSSAESLKVFICGGAPVPAVLVRDASRILSGCRVCNAYGQSEALLITAISVHDDEEHTRPRPMASRSRVSRSPQSTPTATSLRRERKASWPIRARD